MVLCGSHTKYGSQPGSHACVCLCNNYSDLTHVTRCIDDFVELRCEKNRFRNNQCYPIAENHCPEDPMHAQEIGAAQSWIIGSDRYCLKDNVLEGHNATAVRKSIASLDANTLYLNDEPCKWQLNWTSHARIARDAQQ